MKSLEEHMKRYGEIQGEIEALCKEKIELGNTIVKRLSGKEEKDEQKEPVKRKPRVKGPGGENLPDLDKEHKFYNGTSER